MYVCSWTSQPEDGREHPRPTLGCLDTQWMPQMLTDACSGSISLAGQMALVLSYSFPYGRWEICKWGRSSPSVQKWRKQPKPEIGLSSLIRNLCFSLCLSNRNFRVHFASLVYIHSALHLLNLVIFLFIAEGLYPVFVFFFFFSHTQSPDIRHFQQYWENCCLSFSYCPVPTSSL